MPKSFQINSRRIATRKSVVLSYGKVVMPCNTSFKYVRHIAGCVHCYFIHA